jgi:cyclic pyranopterin phosphate synthase
MRDITGKTITLRKAIATGFISMKEETLEKIRNDQIEKGSVIDTARASGFMAAKNTQNLIPHCHPVTIDGMEIQFKFLNKGDQLENLEKETSQCGIQVLVEAKSIGRTGIEMEALTAVSLSCLTVYDMIKYLNDPYVEISTIRLIEKKGGKSDRKKLTKTEQQAVLLICSEEILQGKKENKVGPLISSILTGHNCIIVDEKLISGNRGDIITQIKSWADTDIPFIFTAGGTGLGENDQVSEAISDLIEKEMAGITDAMLIHGYLRTPLAMLSRTKAGIYKNSLIVTLPGSTNGARESLEAILPGIFQTYNMIRIKRN